MGAEEALLRTGVVIMDEVGHWYRDSQTHPVGSAAWVQAQGALEALNRLSERVYVMLQQQSMQEAGLPIPAEPTTLRVITGGRQ